MLWALVQAHGFISFYRTGCRCIVYRTVYPTGPKRPAPVKQKSFLQMDNNIARWTYPISYNIGLSVDAFLSCGGLKISPKNTYGSRCIFLTSSQNLLGAENKYRNKRHLNKYDCYPLSFKFPLKKWIDGSWFFLADYLITQILKSAMCQKAKQKIV